MASDQIAFLAIVAILLPTVTLATQFVVGDDSGWTVNFDYQEWAKDKVFQVGDQLVFKYNPSKHNVFKVNVSAFNECSMPAANEALTTGNDVITLATPGNKWYICGKPNHCSDLSQKLEITVQAKELGSSKPEDSAAHGVVRSVFQLVMVAMIAAAMILV